MVLECFILYIIAHIRHARPPRVHGNPRFLKLFSHFCDSSNYISKGMGTILTASGISVSNPTLKI